MFHKKNVFTIVLILLSSTRCAEASQTLTVNQTIDLLDGALQSVRSFDVHVDCSDQYFIKTEAETVIAKGKKEFIVKSQRRLSPNEKPDSRRESFRQVFQHGKGRVEFLEKDGDHSHTVTVYDGETQKSYDSVHQSALIQDQAIQGVIGRPEWDYLLGFRNVEGDLSVVECLRKRTNVTISEINDSTITLETLPCPKEIVRFSPLGFRVTLDKRHGFMPSSIERIQEVQEKNFIVRKTKVDTWKDLGGGIWVPIKVVTDSFDFDTKWNTFGALAAESVVEVDISRSSWNKDLPEETFNLYLPKGTKVSDLQRGIEFVTGKADPGHNLNELAAHAKQVVRIPVLGRGPSTQPQPQPAKRVSWILGALVIMVSSVLLLLILRYRRRKAGHKTT